MSRKYLIPALLVMQVVVFLLLASVFVQQPAASASGAAAPQDKPEEQIAVNGLYLWSMPLICVRAANAAGLRARQASRW
jgi:hypothetical protein